MFSVVRFTDFVSDLANSSDKSLAIFGVRFAD